MELAELTFSVPVVPNALPDAFKLTLVASVNTTALPVPVPLTVMV